MSVDAKDDLGQEIPGPAWFACMEFPGLDAGREIVRLRWANENLSRIIEGMRLQFDATADELRVERDRAERLLQEQATEFQILRETLRQAEGWIESLSVHLQKPLGPVQS